MSTREERSGTRPRQRIDRRTTRTIPDAALDTIVAHQGHDAPLVARLRNPPPGTHVGALERHLASNVTRLTMPATGLDFRAFWDLCAVAAGRPYGEHR